MGEELLGVFCVMDDRGVINIPKPDSRRVGGSADGSGFKVFHKQVCYQWAYGGFHGHTMYLFVILTLECDKGTFKAELKEGDNSVNGQGGPTAYLWVLVYPAMDDVKGRVHQNQCEKGFHIIGHTFPLLKLYGFDLLHQLLAIPNVMLSEHVS